MRADQTKLYRCIRGITLAALALPSAFSSAQEQRFEDIELVPVYGRRIAENLQEIPISMSAFSELELKNKGIENLTDVARSTPGFSFENFNGAFPQPTFRGQSQSSLINPVQNVATFYNGVYLPRQYMIDASLLNVSRVEVLKGPQSASLGRNAFAGAITFSTKRPGAELDADIEMSLGTDDYQKIKGGISGPIIPGILSGIAGVSDEEWDGSWENDHPLADAAGARTSGNLGGFEAESYMFGLRLTPTEMITIDLAYSDSERDVENPAQWSMAGNQTSYSTNALNCGAIGSLGPSLWCGEIPISPVFAEGDERISPNLVIDPRTGVTLGSEILSLEAEFAISDSFSINYLYGDTEGTFEGAGASVPNQVVGYDGPAVNPVWRPEGSILFDTTGNGSIESDSHEVRFTYNGENLKTFGGLLTATTDDLTDFALVNVPSQTEGPLDPGFAITNDVFALSSLFGLSGRALDAREITSAFGLIEYSFGDVTFSGELRYAEEDITNTNFFSEVVRDASFEYFTPRVTAKYAITETNRVILSYASGTKAGGFNSFFIDPSQGEYDEEKNTTIEFMSRNELADGSIILNATFYYIDAKDLQVLEDRIGANGTVLGNQSAAETFGVEAEFEWNVSDQFTLYTNVGYADATFDDDVIDPGFNSRCDDVVCSTTGDIGGNQLPRAPKITFNAGFDIEGQINETLGYFANANVGYQDKQYLTNINVTEIPSRTIVDLNVGARWNRFEAKLAADNLFDEEYSSSAFSIGFLQTYTANLGDRRRVTLSLSYDM